jgi:hypothetical protein
MSSADFAPRTGGLSPSEARSPSLRRATPPSTTGIKEFISSAEYEMKSLMDYLELAGDQMKRGSELDEVNDLKKYIALTLSHWKRNASVATESFVELAGLINLEKNITQNQQAIITEQDQLLTLLNQEKESINSKVKEAESLLQSSGITSDDIDSNNADAL